MAHEGVLHGVEVAGPGKAGLLEQAGKFLPDAPLADALLEEEHVAAGEGRLHGLGVDGHKPDPLPGLAVGGGLPAGVVEEHRGAADDLPPAGQVEAVESVWSAQMAMDPWGILVRGTSRRGTVKNFSGFPT